MADSIWPRSAHKSPTSSTPGQRHVCRLPLRKAGLPARTAPEGAPSRLPRAPCAPPESKRQPAWRDLERGRRPARSSAAPRPMRQVTSRARPRARGPRTLCRAENLRRRLPGRGGTHRVDARRRLRLPRPPRGRRRDARRPRGASPDARVSAGSRRRHGGAGPEEGVLALLGRARVGLQPQHLPTHHGSQ